MKKLCLKHDWQYNFKDYEGKILYWYGNDRDCEAKCEKCQKLHKFKGGHIFQDIPERQLKRCTRCGREFSTAPKPLSLAEAIDRLAHYQSFSVDRTEETRLAERVLELNFNHPAVKNMEALIQTDIDKAKKYAQVLYSQALLIAGLPLENPSEYTDLVCSLM